jgi:hypothetical protein
MMPKRPDPATVRHITTWLNEMAAMARHPNDEKPNAKSLILMAAMLADDFSIGAFTIASMQTTLRGKVFFPLYEEVRQCVGEWWRENRPVMASALLEGPAADPSLSAMDRYWMAYWYRRIVEIDAGPAWRGNDPHQSPRARLASLIRQYAPDAWKVISRGAEVYRKQPARHVVDDVVAALRARTQGGPSVQQDESEMSDQWEPTA